MQEFKCFHNIYDHPQAHCPEDGHCRPCGLGKTRTEPFQPPDFNCLQYVKSIFHTVSDKNLGVGKAGYEGNLGKTQVKVPMTDSS